MVIAVNANSFQQDSAKRTSIRELTPRAYRAWWHDVLLEYESRCADKRSLTFGLLVPEIDEKLMRRMCLPQLGQVAAFVHIETQPHIDYFAD